MLWGRAAATCSNPGCRAELTTFFESSGDGHIGEMAHVISHSPGGPRSSGAAGSDSYENLILLCPSCHTTVDKNEVDHPESMLREWKSQHEADVVLRLRGRKVTSIEELKNLVTKRLAENRALWAALGPNSEAAKDPVSNTQMLWELRKQDTIVPNNQWIVNLIEVNSDLVASDDFEAFARFKMHAAAFSEHCLSPKDNYPTFPTDFADRFRS